MSPTNEYHLYLYGPDGGPLRDDFDTVAARLQGIPKLYWEPDGSFVCSRDVTSANPTGQLFGMVYDAADRVRYVDLRGTSGRETFAIVVRAIGGDDRNLTVVTTADGRLHDLQSFEKATFQSEPS